jgi:hypothetical protein
VKIGNDAANIALVNFVVGTDDLDAGALTLADAFSSTTTQVIVVVKVTLSEPVDLAQYTAVINQPITFDVNFTAE